MDNSKKEKCVYDGKEYSHGSKLCASGEVIRCHDGEWEDTGEACDDESRFLKCITARPDVVTGKVKFVNKCGECKMVWIEFDAGDGRVVDEHVEVKGRSRAEIEGRPGWNWRLLSEWDCKEDG